MKALVLKAYNRFVVEEVPAPSIAPDEVLIRVKACGICGSDVHGMDGSTGRRRPPVIMGHEAAGTIAETGSGVSSWKPGDRVTFDSTISCGACWHCRRGEINLCDNRRVLGVSCAEYRRDGAFAEFVAVPARILYRLPDSLPFEEAALVESLSVAVHAVGRAPVRPGDTALVVGAGTIGLLAMQVLKARGCTLVATADVASERLELARRLGADAGIDTRTGDTAAEMRRLTDGRGADIVVEAVGLPATIRIAVESVRKGGALALVGNFSPEIVLPLQSVVTREIALFGSCASNGEYPACLDLMAGRRVDVRSLISAVAPLAEGPSWFKRLYDQEPGLLKVILAP
ncbi:MAG: galactitol-1-phosphate 5-dehydrogenase [Spirochaetes bacterium]|nr:galactitol-1-phosphate 5-dehydrogenase [Spirochaetota bacterium]